MALLDVFKKKGKKGKKLSKKSKILDKKKDVKIKEKAQKAKKAVNIHSAAHKILLKPVVSEKASDLGMENKYIFQVSKKASKKDIKRAIKAVYGTVPIKINIVNLFGKSRRYGRTLGRTSDRKKAIITLPKGETIQIYEGV